MVTLSVEPFVMAGGHQCQVPQALGAFENRQGVVRVLPHQLPFVLVQFVGLL